MTRRISVIFSNVLGFIILQALFSCGDPQAQWVTTSSPFKWIKSGAVYDTVYSADKVVTTINFLDKYSLTAEFRYDEDFSFLYPEYFYKWGIAKNGSPVDIETSKIDWAYYFFTNDSILQYQNGNDIYYLLFSKPFYCNGFACSATALLIIKQSKKNTSIYYYDSEFGNDSLLTNSIKELSIKHGHLALPLRCTDIEKDSVCNYVIVDSLKI